jgi:ABC-type branched-subunit amino acid transport system ATPase component
MVAGRIVSEGAPSAVTRDPQVIEAYLGGAPA